jgi:outer membrane lipoprotein-sorting protein
MKKLIIPNLKIKPLCFSDIIKDSLFDGAWQGFGPVALSPKNKGKIKKIVNYANIAACMIFYFFNSPSFCAEKKQQNFSKEYRFELQQIESYLNNIKNLSAEFIQESSGGNLLKGRFFLSRPGKMRIEYITQPKIIIVVNGSVLSYYDVELDEISHLSTNTTPASFLTREKISFDAKDVEITNIKKFADQIKISVMKKNRKEAGEFSLIFATRPLQFVKMEVKNDLDQTIGVTLLDTDFSSIISNEMFIIKKAADD